MAERIVLAQFDIDSRLLEEKIAQNQTKIDLLNGEIRDTRKAIKEYQDQAKLMAGIISEGNKAIETANEELAQGIITQEQYNYIVGLTTDVIRESEVELSRLIAVEREQQLQLVSYRTDLRNVNDENRELNNLLRSGRTELQGSEGAYRELSRQQSAAATESRNLGAQLRELEEAGQQNTAEYAQLSAQYQETTQRAHSMREEMRELTRATGDDSLNVGNYADSFKSAFSELSDGAGMLMSGNVQGGFETFKNGLSGIKSGFADLFKFIKANPWLLIVGAIFTYVKEMYEYNQQVRELNNEVEALANTSGELTDQLRKNATAIQNAYGKDFKEAVQEQKSLMDDFKVSAEEAFNVYNEGLARGGALNAEFGDSIREYGPLFAKNGYSAQEFINILNSGIDLGVYSDKLPDAIKEAGLALTEQGKATRDSLVNAFGAPFSDDLLKRIQSGKTTVADGLDEIAAKSAKMHLNEQQLAQLTADVFKGAGEDAGGVLTIFNALNHAQELNAQGLTDIQKQVIKLAELDRDLAQAKDEAFKSDSMIAFQANMEVAWKEIQILWYKSLGNITSFISDAAKGWRLAGMNTIDFLRLIPNTFSKVVSAVASDLSNLASLAKLSGAIIKDALTLNLDGVEAKFNQLKAGISNAFSNTKREIKIFSSFIGSEGIINVKNRNIITAEEAAKIEAQRQKQAQEAAKKAEQQSGSGKITGSVADAASSAQSKALKDLEKQRSDQQKKIEEAAKQVLANAKERANIAIQATQAELAEYIAMNAEKLKSDKRLTQEKVNEMQRYLESVREKSQIANELEKQQKLQSLNDQIEAIKGVSQQELEQKKNLVAQKEVVEKEYATKELIINNDTNDKRKELDKKFLEEKTQASNLARALEYESQLADLESQHASEYAMQEVQLQQQTEQRLASFIQENELKRQLDQENYDLNAEIEAQRKEIENQLALTQDEVKKQNLQNLLNSLNIIQVDYANKEVEIARNKENAKYALAAGIAANMAQIAGEQTALGKAFAIAETTINTYAAATNAYKSLSGIPIVGPALGAVAAGLAVASGLANVARISGVNIPSGAVSGLKGLSSGVVSIGQMSAKPKAADGILIGPSHANGGIPINTPGGMIEAEGGEIIINKRSSAMYRGVLSQINQLGGGVKFASGGIVGNLGSLSTVQNNFKSVIDMDAMRQIVGEAVLEGSMQGTLAGSQMGIVELSNNREIQNGANF